MPLRLSALALAALFAVTPADIRISAADPPQELPRKGVPYDPQACTVKVGRWEGNEGGDGSGTVVARTAEKALVLTNHHVAPTATAVYSVARGDKTYKAAWVAAAAAPDLGLLAVPADLPAARIAAKDPAAGTRVRHWGKSTGPQVGKVTGVTLFAKAHALAGAYASEAGDSGAGLFDDAGFLVGVHWGRNVNDETRHAVRVADVRAFLKQNAKGFPDLIAALE